MSHETRDRREHGFWRDDIVLRVNRDLNDCAYTEICWGTPHNRSSPKRLVTSPAGGQLVVEYAAITEKGIIKLVIAVLDATDRLVSRERINEHYNLEGR